MQNTHSSGGARLAFKTPAHSHLFLPRHRSPFSHKRRPNNILEWHFVIKGPKDTPYHGGSYHGKLIFPAEYPYKPPAIMMLTPNGRFNTNTRLCLSMSDFHPETWVPAWSVASILNGVLSFMLESTPTVGSVETSLAERRRLARASHAWNRKSALFCELFPDLVVAAEADPHAAESEGADGNGGSGGGGGANGGGDVGGGGNMGAYLMLGLGVVLAVGVGWVVREL